MFSYIDNFYEPNDLGYAIIHFLNEHFQSSHQPREIYYGGDRMNSYPCYESNQLEDKGVYSLPNIFKRTFETKTNQKIYHFVTWLRKTKKEELEKSSSYRQYKQHVDDNKYDIAGLIYFNTASIKDGTYFYNNLDDYEPTAVIGSKLNRCIFYNSQLPHCPSMEQSVEERWVQTFFAITSEKKYNIYKEKNET